MEEIDTIDCFKYQINGYIDGERDIWHDRLKQIQQGIDGDKIRTNTYDMLKQGNAMTGEYT